MPAEAFAGLPNVRDVQVAGTVLRCRLSGPADALVKAAARFTSQRLLAEEPDLEELFLAYYAEEDGRAA